MSARAPGQGRGLAVQAALLGLILIFCVFPFYWMVTTSLKTQLIALQEPPAWVFSPTLGNYTEVLFEDGVGRTLINSLIVAVSTTLLAVGLGAPAAYALARFEFRGKKDLWFWFITNRMVSPIVLALPFFLIVRNLGLLDTHLVLILIYLTFNLPIVIWICTDQFRAIPYDLDEAAILEGASHWRIFRSICLPLAMPGILTGTIIGLAQALGETAPLLLIGMVGYIASNYPDGVASGFLDPNSAMPAQIFEWAKRADPAFYERAWGGIIILLVFLMTMNIIAILLRRRFERRW